MRIGKRQSMATVVVSLLALSSVQATLVDNFEGYATGNASNAAPPWTTSEGMYYGDIVAEGGGNQYISQYGSGDYRDLRVSTPVSITGTGLLSFDVLVNVETGLDNAFGLSHNEGMTWYSDYGPYVRVTTDDGGDANGVVALDTRDGGGFVDNIAYLNVGQWYNIKLDIDTAGGGTFDIYVDDSPVYTDSAFRFTYAGDPLDTFVLMGAAGAVQYNVGVDNIDVIPEPGTLILCGLGLLIGLRRLRRRA